MVAFPMEVLEVECVIPDLIDCLSMVGAFANLEFQDEDTTSRDDNCVDATSDTRHIEFQAEISINSLKGVLKNDDLIFPCSGLSGSDGKNARMGKFSQNVIVVLRKKSRDRLSVK